jgi:lipopolysaccharide export system permease protein
MRLIDRYLFRQLLGPTVFAALALTAVAILTSSLSALDLLVNERQSPVVFAEITLLATPQIVSMILPLAVFIAGLVALNRLHTEQEIVICFAGGMSRWRVASPAIRLASFLTIITLVINLWIQPICFREMRTILLSVRSDIATTLIVPGQFTHPSSGLTVFAQTMDGNGLIRNLFIDHANANGSASTVMASEGRLAKRDGAPVLILRHGSNQQFAKNGDLNTLWFDEYVLDLHPFLAVDPPLVYVTSDRFLHELVYPDLRQTWERQNIKSLMAEANARLSTPLYNLTFMALALAAVLGGAFSRLGYGARIYAASAAAGGIRVLGFVANAAAENDPQLNVIQYALPLVCFIAAMLLVLRQHPARGPRRLPILAPAPAGAAA